MAHTEIQVVNDVANRRMYSPPSYRSPLPSEEWKTHFTSSVLSQLHIGLIVVDQKENIIEINSAAYLLLDLDRESPIACTMMDLVSRLNQDEEEFHRLAQFLTAGYSPLNRLELNWNTSASKKRLVIRKGIEEQTGFTFFFIENKTDYYQLAEQICFRERLATIGQMAAGTAHEIRNPLTSIKGFLQMMGNRLQEKGQWKEKVYVEIMLKELSRINRLVSELMVLSKPKQLNKGFLNIRRIIHEILPIIKSEATLHNIDVVVDVNSVHPPELMGDSEKLKQVFLNLSKNAIEAMRETGGTVTIRLRRSDDDRHLIEIEDEGPGIPANLQKRIFEPFFTTKERGTGLGLPICQQIIQEIGGELCLKSSSQGSCFQVYLPISSR